jgi:hypothetical protein
MNHTADLFEAAAVLEHEVLQPASDETVTSGTTGEADEVIEDFRIPAPMMEIFGPVGPVIEECFRRMSLAEAAIKRFCRRHPAKAKRINKAFGILCWRLPGRATDQIFIAHMEELLQRVVDGQSVSEATRAEALVFLNSASLRAPMPQQVAALYAQLFQELLHIEALFEEDKYPTEPWHGASAELLEKLRRDLRAADRIFPSTGDAK